jgi:hypothetical protein
MRVIAEKTPAMMGFRCHRQLRWLALDGKYDKKDRKSITGKKKPVIIIMRVMVSMPVARHSPDTTITVILRIHIYKEPVAQLLRVDVASSKLVDHGDGFSVHHLQ